MIGVVVTAHGNLAASLVDTARLVVPRTGRMIAVGIESADDTTTYETRLKQAIESAQDGTGVLVLTDMFGGTPSNVGMTVHAPGVVEVLTGVNLPMLIKALQLSQQETDLTAAAQKVRAAGHRSIAVASEILAVPPDESQASATTTTGRDP